MKFDKKKFYDSDYHSKRHKHLIEDDEYYFARAEASTRLYFSNVDKLRIFEYGCGIGQGIVLLPKAAGYDVSKEARYNCQKRGIKTYSEFKKIPKGAWDIVFCRHALEHMERPLETLNKLRLLLKPEGILRLILPKEKNHRASFIPDLNQHLYCWNFRAINNLLNRAQYEVLDNRETYILGYRALLPVRRYLGSSTYFWSAKLVGRLLNNGELWIDAKIKARDK